MTLNAKIENADGTPANLRRSDHLDLLAVGTATAICLIIALTGLVTGAYAVVVV